MMTPGTAGTAEGRRVVELKTPGEIEAIRAAGVVVADVLGAARAHAAPGITLRELDEAARDILKKAGATSPFLTTSRGSRRSRTPR
jgi:methionyl aminopeptidase